MEFKDVTIRDLSRRPQEHLGEAVRLKGWVRTHRDQKEVIFIGLNDGSFYGNFQVVAPDTLNNIEEVRKMTIGTAFEVEGNMVESQGAGQDHEIEAHAITI